MRKSVTPSQRAVNNIRTRLRKDMAALALTHRGCESARGCGCFVDRSLDALEKAEAQLFKYELDSYANPKSPRLELIDGVRVVSEGDATLMADDDLA